MNIRVIEEYYIEYNIDTSAGHPTSEGDDIVRTISKDIELQNKESVR